MGFGGFRRSYWKNIFSQLEKYFSQVGKKQSYAKLANLQNLQPPSHPLARAYNKVNFDF